MARLVLTDAGASLVLMDERAGRAVAMEHGLVVAGTAAIIGMAKTRGLIGSARRGTRLRVCTAPTCESRRR